jgi:hypothetical protein
MTAENLQELRDRNETRLKEAKEKLGSKWLLHPDNSPRKFSTHDLPPKRYSGL